MADVFVSYAAEDRDRIQSLVELLEREGWTVWWDRELVAGPNFDEAIQSAIDAAACIVVAWSATSIQSAWCRDEAREGLERRRLVPLRIDDVRPPLGFRSAHTASLVGWPGDRGDLEGLLRGVRRCIGGDQPATTAPTPVAIRDGIAVLPFTNLSSDPEQDYFCDGLAEDLIDLLARDSSLKVIARTSSFQFKGAAHDVREIGRQLGIQHLVEGSVRRAGDKIRVAVQLVRADDGASEWTERYDRRLDDIFALQEEIAGKIATALNATLQPSPQPPSQSPAAHLLYLQAKHLLDLGADDEAVLLRARDLLKEASQLDPQHVRAWTELSRAYSQLAGAAARRDSSAEPGTISIEEGYRLAREAAERARSIDPDGAARNLGSGWGHFLDGDKVGAARRFERVLGRNPTDPKLLHNLVRPLTWALRFRDAVAVGEYVAAHDPLNVINIDNLALAYFQANRTADAEAQIRQSLALNAKDRYAVALLGTILLLRNEHDAVLDLAARADDSIERHSLRAMALHSLGQHAAGRDAYETLRDRWPLATQQIACVHAWRGEANDAFQLLHQAIDRSLPEERFVAVNTLIDPRWRPLHDDPRWQSFLEKTHQTDRHLAEFSFAINLP